MPQPFIHYQTLLHVFVLSMLLLSATLHGRDQPGASSGVGSTHSTHLQSLIETAVREGLPGVSLRVQGPGIDFRGAAGVADINTGEPLTTQHAMYTASLGKTFTAVIALQLCDEGRIDLEAPISNGLPADISARIPSSQDITLRHLLSHTSGLIDYMNDQKAWRSEFARDPYRQWTHRDVVPYLYDIPLLFEPGSDYHYSNSNYILAGLIIEQASGQPLHALIRKRILVPLGLRHTFVGGESISSEQRAHGYIKRHGRIIDTYPWYSHYGLADSGVHSTPAELALFIRSLFKTEGILDATIRKEMTHASNLGHPPSEYGMGIYIQRNPWGAGHIWFTHDGIDPGYQADMMYIPERDLTIVLAANASMGRAGSIYENLIRAVIRTALDPIQ